MEILFMAVAITTLVFSVMALIISIACYIKIKAVELSKYEFIPVDQHELMKEQSYDFETNLDTINEQLEDDDIDKEIDNTFEPGKRRISEVIL